MRNFVLVSALVLGGCRAQSDIAQVTYFDNGALGITEVQRSGIGVSQAKRSATFVVTSPEGKVVDLAFVLDDGAEKRLADRVARVNAQGSRQLMVVTVPIDKHGSLELFGWGVRMPQTMMALMVDPDAGAVRIEGPMSAEAKALIVRQMQPALKAHRLEEALTAGIDRLGS
ncbi:TPM domain-containing protein [Sphingomonas humi]|uniref:TPM domain-containing protein n=1 Tax=Sphingomonas humi TaxID=335630 RepID=A0ABP7S0K7_9SPHN